MDPESGKTLVFITNNFVLPAATICASYKSRWQVELFFAEISRVGRLEAVVSVGVTVGGLRTGLGPKALRPRFAPMSRD